MEPQNKKRVLLLTLFLAVIAAIVLVSAFVFPPVVVTSASPNPTNLTSIITGVAIDLSGTGIAWVRIFEDGGQVKECTTSVCVYVAVHPSPGIRSYYATTQDNAGGTATSN